jgi:hypothetical protein
VTGDEEVDEGVGSTGVEPAVVVRVDAERTSGVAVDRAYARRRGLGRQVGRQPGVLRKLESGQLLLMQIPGS